MSEKSVHQFTVNDAVGVPINLADYKGKVLLIVNTASECGFTPQLRDLQELHEELKDEAFEILAFPSNDFGGQEPLEGTAINEFCELKFGSKYKIFEKIRVRGPYAAPLYAFLADKKLNGHVAASPRWNFHKYLINQDGEVMDYFFPFTKPNSSRIKKRILRLLHKSDSKK